MTTEEPKLYLQVNLRRINWGNGQAHVGFTGNGNAYDIKVDSWKWRRAKADEAELLESGQTFYTKDPDDTFLTVQLKDSCGSNRVQGDGDSTVKLSATCTSCSGTQTLGGSDFTVDDNGDGSYTVLTKDGFPAAGTWAVKMTSPSSLAGFDLGTVTAKERDRRRRRRLESGEVVDGPLGPSKTQMLRRLHRAVKKLKKRLAPGGDLNMMTRLGLEPKLVDEFGRRLGRSK